MPISRFAKPVLAVTLGDPGGIGPEVTLKALASLRPSQLAFFVYVGDVRFLQGESRKYRLRHCFYCLRPGEPLLTKPRCLTVLHTSLQGCFIQGGRITRENGKAALISLGVATQLALKGQVRGIVTAPVSKAAIKKLDPTFVGQTEFLARSSGVKDFAMMLCGGPLRVTLVTTHVAIKEVSSHLDKREILSKIMLTDRFLKERLRIRSPRLAVAALNPHAGESQTVGLEEKQKILPAVMAARRRGVRVEGPLAADRLFYDAYRGRYDAEICMYHDQGLGPLKMIAFDEGINLTLGLPFVRTSPDHGTAFDISGKGIADPASTVEALKWALRLVRA